MNLFVHELATKKQTHMMATKTQGSDRLLPYYRQHGSYSHPLSRENPCQARQIQTHPLVIISARQAQRRGHEKLEKLEDFPLAVRKQL
jgi:hypothetical protein